MEEEKSAKDLLEEREWHVWVMSYGISHGRRMELSLHHGVPKHTGVICGWVSHFSGDFEGGPYRLRVMEQGTGDQRKIRIESDDGRFTVICSDIEVGRLRLPAQ